MFGYIHEGWETGVTKWGPWQKLNLNPKDFLFIFPAMPSHAAQDDIRVN